MKKLLSFLLSLTMLLSFSCMSSADSDAAERGRAAIEATGWGDVLVLPQEESYLSEWKTLYARKAFKAPCLRVERISALHTGRQVMPYLYEGVEATVVAEENDMSCILYRGNDNQLYAGWIQSIRLLEEFPGEQYTVATCSCMARISWAVQIGVMVSIGFTTPE